MGPCIVRPAREEDLERMVEIHGCAYPGSGTFEQQKRGLTRGSLGGLEVQRVVERSGRIVGCGALYPLEVWIGGQKVPVGGVGSVAVAPEARRQGVARALLTSMHAEMEASGTALSLLYPFEEGFYAKLGYGVTCPILTLRVSSRKLLSLHNEGNSSGLTAVAAEGSSALALYDQVARRTSGLLARSEIRWLARFSNETRYWMGVAAGENDLRGYASFSYHTRAGETEPTLVVHEMTTSDDEAKRALLVAIGRQCDQVRMIDLAVSFDDPLVLGLQGAQGKLERGPMVRPIDTRRALMSRGYRGEGEVKLLCTSDQDRKTLRLSVRSGVAEVTEANGSADIELAGGTLGSLVASGLRPSEAAKLGLLRASEDAVRIADQIFVGPRFQCLDAF